MEREPVVIYSLGSIYARETTHGPGSAPRRGRARASAAQPRSGTAPGAGTGRWLRAAAMVAACALPGLASAAATPPSITVDGQALQRAGAATREILFTNVYRVSMYLPAGKPVAALGRDAVSKAFRVEVLYDGDLAIRIPPSWQEELAPLLDQAQLDALRRFCRAASRGDVILIEYSPRFGTSISGNETELVRERGAAVIDAFVEVWLGDEPVSARLKASLLGHDRHARRSPRQR